MNLKGDTSMKKKLGICAALVLTAIAARAIWVYNAYLFNGVVAYTQNAVLNLNTTPNASGIARITAQAVYSSSTLPTDTFNDGRVSTASITVASNSGLVAAAATNQVTIAADAVIKSSASYDSLVVNSTNGLTGASITLNGTVLPNGGWRVDLASHTATDIAAQINTYVYQVIATASGSTVNLVARANGSAGNAYTLVSSTPSAISATTASFVGGQDPAFRNAYITVNGTKYPRGYYWNLPGTPETSTGTATSIAALLNTISGIQANAAGSVVYATATVAGAAANSFTLVSSTPAAMTVANPTFTGGVSNAVITINGTALTQGTQWTKGASVTLTAQSIASAINTAFTGLITATNVAGVVNSTSTNVGTLANYTLVSSTPAALTVSHPTYVGGQNASFTILSPVINIPAHGYVTGVQLLLTGATQPAPLTAGTTYFAISVDANDIELATTLNNAKAGTYITLTSSSTTGPHTSTLTPLAIAGTPGLQWQVSNDCVNYVNYTTTSLGVAVSSLTFPTPYTAGVTTWDLGPVNYQCLQAALTGPSAGGWALQLKINGSNP